MLHLLRPGHRIGFALGSALQTLSQVLRKKVQGLDLESLFEQPGGKQGVR